MRELEHAPASRAAPATRADARPAVRRRSLLALQQTHGNRYVARAAAGGGELTPEVEDGIERTRGAGSPLEADVRARLEPSFGVDLASVRVHTAGYADALSRSLGARAFTTGRDVYFRAGAYDPSTTAGRELLAHELAHVVQQGGDGAVQARLDLDPVDDEYEREADDVARSVVQRWHDGERSVPGANAAIRWDVERATRDDATGDLRDGAPLRRARRVVQRQPTAPHLVRGYAGEQTMGFVQYRWEDGWAIVRGTGGSQGHAVNAGGEDALAYNFRTGVLRIADNKAFARAGNVGSATAISDNLGQNVDGMITAVEGMPPEQLPMRQDVLRLLRQTRAALRAGTPLPGRVDLVVHGEGGASTGVTARLRAMGIRFVASPATVETAAEGAARAPLVGGPRPTMTPEGQYEFPGMSSRQASRAGAAEAASASAEASVSAAGARAAQAPEQLELALGESVARAEVAAASGGAEFLSAATFMRGLRVTGNLLVGALIGLLVGWGLARLEEASVRRAFAALEPRIDAGFRAVEARVAALQARAFPATVWVHVAIRTTRSITTSFMAGAYTDTFMGVDLVRVDVSTEYVSTHSTSSGPHFNTNYGGYDIGSQITYDDVTYSFPLPYTAPPSTAEGRAARIAAIERDTRRSELPATAIDTLFQERQALIAEERTR
jgi:hypothetical protein